ncbi:MAG: AraC family transcriptional regulator [Planctomycetes bacterium]|nr:AraC family transcriptional regulator [Planctomycetota bacterium]
MRSPGEVSVTAPEDLSGRFRCLQAALATALAGAALSLVSCRRWRTDPAWSIPPRRLDDLFLFAPVRGALVMTGPAGPEPLAPGAIAIVPHGVAHAVAYAAGQRSCTVLAVHLHLTTAWGTPWATAADRLVSPLPDPGRWHADLARLAGIAQDDAALGAALGQTMLRHLLLDAVLAGHPLHPPASGLDPRLAAIIAALQADPGAAPPITALARSQGIGPLRLRQLFHAGLGCSPKAYVDRLRLARAQAQLRAGRPVGEVATACGYGTVRQLQVRFKAAFGITPSASRVGRGSEI